jgi:hypothetical protein
MSSTNLYMNLESDNQLLNVPGVVSPMISHEGREAREKQPLHAGVVTLFEIPSGIVGL